MSHRHPRAQEGTLEGKTTSQQKGDQIGAPVGGDIGYLGDEFTLMVKTVTGQIATQVSIWRKADGHRRTCLGYLEHRTRFRVAVAEEEKIKSPVAGENNQVRLHITFYQASGRASPLPGSNQLTCLRRIHPYIPG